ncbi:hypothetical protein AOL_s00215g903 [Orbilia oligospora ATCC 24927]|uniref:Uncharacterized protein n=3 Tax=Orbilia oligospora TaxID=2813651 RepID=G1XV95_ARTOA|nr:hypothetical protein AOL_s00215g903 [Orbilia oligospora ATCC 24927]EGX42954.1 hypothetical protein AOL_s00215g903 [Orbilia oligospora ATCC 24927]KAF3273912.1 hypothetical protein TWF970_008321 [Orbilia oligospora]
MDGKSPVEIGAIAAILAPVLKLSADPFDLLERSNKTPSQRNVPFNTRIHHFTWAWYLPVMGTGGIAVQLHLLPYRFQGLDTIGTVIFLISVAIFCLTSTGLLIRFSLWKNTLPNSIRHPTEGLFTAAFLLSVATILINTCNYGVGHIGEPSHDNWLSRAIEVLFWIYTFVSIILAIALSYFIISRESHTPQAATPAWALPCFPAMLVGSVGATVSRTLSTVPGNHGRVFPIIITSILLQGFGILISLMFITIFLKRLMLFRLPSPNLRPGMFMAVGPPGFTSFTIVALGQLGQTEFRPSDFGTSANFNVGDAFYVTCLLTGMLFYGLAGWWLLVSATAVIAGASQKHVLRKKKVDFDFHLSWWAFLFPNTGFIGATILLGDIFSSVAVKWVGTALVIIECAVWLMLIVQTPLAVWRGRLMVPGKDEDANVEGFTKEDEIKRW